MAGLYLHIPFCKKKCHYCNFHFSTNLSYKEELFNCLLKEIALQHALFSDQQIETIYLGGGTPSLLTQHELHRLFDQIDKWYNISSDAEITLEANPDDLYSEKVTELAKTPVNRLSIGIQSFHDEDLQYLGRVHNGNTAELCLQQALDKGFENISIDLIYGIPTLTEEKWMNNLEKTFSLKIPHISAYALTVEEKTALAHFIKSGKTDDPDDEQSAKHFKRLMDEMEKRGYIHYEISNFSLPGKASRHNRSYWQGIPYLGIGPSAHSFFFDDMRKSYIRRWNISNNMKYINHLKNGDLLFDEEILSNQELHNEYILTGLRTIEGIDISFIEKKFGKKYVTNIEQNIADFLQTGWISSKNHTFRLTQQGKFFADRIISELFL